jgi:outer membrane lipoprotein LolB
MQKLDLLRTSLVIVMICTLQACVSGPYTESSDSVTSALRYQEHQATIASIQQFSLKGRVGVQAEGKGFSGSLTWQHSATNDNVALFSPLGSQVARITKTTSQVTLTDDKGSRVSEIDAETLTEKVLGWKLPLSGLADWSLGRPARGNVQDISWDAQGHLMRLKQDDWEVEYQSYTKQENYVLPAKLVLRNEKVNLKLLIEQWQDIAN